MSLYCTGRTVHIQLYSVDQSEPVAVSCLEVGGGDLLDGVASGAGLARVDHVGLEDGALHVDAVVEHRLEEDGLHLDVVAEVGFQSKT